MRNYHSKNCRLCKNQNLTKIVELTPTPWADDYRVNKKKDEKYEIVPLKINLCDNCHHAQLSHIINAEDIYLNYTYESSSSPGLRDHFKKASDTIINKFKPSKKGLAIDIGSNDGMLLKNFKNFGMRVLGIDPMPGISDKAKESGIDTLSDFFNSDFSKKVRKQYGSAEIITANNLVADTDDLDDFIFGVKNLMDENSIFIFESFYFYLQIKNFIWDFTYHEHYSYFTITSLEKYFNSIGMKIIDVEEIPTKGGSMRTSVQLINGKHKIFPSVEKFKSLEKNFGFPDKKLFKEYCNDIEKSKMVFLSEMNKISKLKKKISAYGASATSTTLIYHYEINKFIDCIFDDFKVKQGLYSPGYNIPVLNPEDIYKNPPDYIIILAWRYKDQIIKKHKKFLDNGGKFIIPLPKFEIYKS